MDAELTVPETTPAHIPEDDDRIPGYSRLSISDIGTALRLSEEGLDQAAIAQHLGCNQSSVSRVLRKLGPDATALAIRRFKRDALDSAERVIALAKASKPDTALKAEKVILHAAGVLQASQVAVGIQVTLGVPGQSPLGVRQVQLEPAIDAES